MEIITPDGIELTVHIFATSDETGLDTEVKLGGLKSLSPFEGERDPAKFLSTMLPSIATDWRLMTREEIVEYKADKSDELADDLEEAAA